jgi:hypothetical protein
MQQPLGSAGITGPTRQRPHKQALWYGTRPPGRNVAWDGPGWYTLAAKKTLLIRVG